MVPEDVQILILRTMNILCYMVWENERINILNGIKFSNHMPLKQDYLGFSEWAQDNDMVLNMGEEDRNSQCQTDEVWKKSDCPLLALEMEGGHMPKNMNRVWKLQKSKKQIDPRISTGSTALLIPCFSTMNLFQTYEL